MAVTKPLRRTCRQFTDGSYGEGGKSQYILHPKFANEPEHYVRALILLQRDLQDIFEYVEPADPNLACYSYRIHALHMRTCIEIEANLKAILFENGYSKPGDWNMGDYKKLDQTHQLSMYEVRLPVWKGTHHSRKPFAPWSTGAQLKWYQAYNAAKHDRHDEFPQANFEHLLAAISGLVTLLSSQFYTWDFSPSAPGLALEGMGGPPHGFETAIGNYFWVKFPTVWPAVDQYDFDWQSMKSDPDPFDKLTF